MTYDKAREEKLVGYLVPARERHFKNVQPIVDGFISISIDTDIDLIPWGIKMHAGVYHLRSGEPAQDAAVYVMRMDEQSVIHAAEAAIESGEGEQPEKITLRMIAEPILVAGRPLKYLEALTFAAIGDAKTPQEADDIFRTAFNIGVDRGGTTPGRERKGKYLKVNDLAGPGDEITHALFGRDKGGVDGSDYHTGGEIKVLAGTKGKKRLYTTLQIVNNAQIDDLEKAYRMDAYDLFWFDAVCSIANAGRWTMRGSEILSVRGYKNPYRKEAQTVLSGALRSILKMNTTKVAIDTTGLQGAYPDVRKEYTIQSIIDGNIRLQELNDGTHDFTIELNQTDHDTPLEALPIAAYASDKGQMLFAKPSDMTFPGLKLTLDHRVMWQYVLRRIKSKSAKKTIVFDTLFRNIGMESDSRKKKDQMLRQLRKMLDTRRREGSLSYTWNRKPSGDDYSVEITVRDRANELAKSAT